MGIQFSSPRQRLLFAMWQFWKQGISPNEFKKTSLKDITTVIEIDNAINERLHRYQKTQQTVASMRRKW
jgi:hypothetical protein